MSSLKTLDKSLNLLSLFTHDKKSWGLRELADELNMNHTVVYRILCTFEKHGFLIKNSESKKYELGLKFWGYSLLLEDKIQKKDIFKPFMEDLVEKTGETAYLTWLENFEAVSVEIVHSPSNIKFDVKVGMYKPLYAGASNKVLLAYLNEEEINSILNQNLKKYTSKTDIDKNSIKSELKKIHEQGWSITYGEYNDDVIGVSIPLFDVQNKIFGSLNIAGLKFRMNEEKIQLILEEMLEKRKEIHDYLTTIKFDSNSKY